uniref:THAP domain containing 3 n=1 Tax=Sphenodon punctatus TaxID=8508 RepID=A0A8D0H528_SPHPU
MPKSCAALGCGARYSARPREKVTFHRFPRSRPELLARWVRELGRGGCGDDNFRPGYHAVICSRHFRPDCFSHHGNRANLKPDAVPTLFPAARNPTKMGKERIPPEDAKDPKLSKDFTGTESGADVRQSDTEPVLPQEKQSRVEELAEAVSAVQKEDWFFQSRLPGYRDHFPVQTSDHSYAIVDCASLKQKLFGALEENEKLQKQLKVKSMELRRMFLRLQACRKEQRKLKGKPHPGRDQSLTF